MDFESQLREVRATHGSMQTELLISFIQLMSNGVGDGDICVAIKKIHETLGPEALRTFFSTVSMCEGTHLLLAKSQELMEAVKLLDAMNDYKALITFLELLDKALNHVPDDFVHKIAIVPFIKFAAERIGSADLGLSDVSSSVVISTLGSQLVNSDTELKEAIRSVLAEKLKASNLHGDCTTELRYATVMSKIMAKSDAHFNACLECGVVAAVLALCQTDDILMQVCALDLIKDVARTVEGLKYLYSQGVVDWLLAMLGEGQANAPAVDPILSAGALTVLSDVLTMTMECSAQMLQDANFPPSRLDTSLLARILHAITHKLETIDDSGRLSGLNAIANFACTSPDSMQLIVDDADTIEKWLGLLNTAKMEIKAACLHSVARVVECDAASSSSVFSSASKDAKLKLLESLGRIKGQPVVTFLVQIARQPIDEMRHAAMHILRAIATAGGWGLELLYMNRSSASSGFRSFLENRATEHSKEGRDSKFSLIQSIASNPSFGLLQEDVRNAIQTLIVQGAYYNPPQVVVGTEEM